MKIVIVDNIDDNMPILKAKLEDIADVKEVILADNEMEALNLVRDEYELFILNTAIDGVDGHFVSYCLKKFKKVIIYTDIDDEDKIEKIDPLRIVDYIIKSISPDAVLDTVKRVINNSQYNILFYSNDKDKMEIVSHLDSQNLNFLEAKKQDDIIEYLTYNKIDMVLLDFEQLLAEDLNIIMDIRQKFPKDILPITMLQYFSNKKNIISSFLKAGVNNIIYKPYLKEELVNTINFSFLKKDSDECNLVDVDTGLYKLEFFKESGKKILNNSIRENRPVSLAIIEIDHLKDIIKNRNITAKVLLKHLAKLLTNSLRTGDIICEYSSGKIAILMSNTPSNNAFFVIDRVRQKIKRLPFIIDEASSINYTISGGVADKGGYDLNVMIDMADEYLYRAKKFGMDRIEILEEGN